MINKVAEMTRLAEVRGCMAAFHDAGLIKVANEGAFDELCETVADNIGYDYDLEKIAAVTDAVLSGGGMTKTAHETARNAALGELLLMKTAGRIDDATFRREVGKLMKMALKMPSLQTIKGLPGKASSVAKNALIAKGLREAFANKAGYGKKLMEAGKTLGAYGALGGAAYGGKALYDNYSEPVVAGARGLYNKYIG